MDVARVNPHWSGQGEPPLQLACFTTRQASSSHPTPGGWGRHEVSLSLGGRLTPGPDGIGHGGWGMTFEESKKEDWLRAERGNQPSMAATPVLPAQLAGFHVNPPPTPQSVGAAREISRICYGDAKMRGLVHLP